MNRRERRAQLAQARQSGGKAPHPTQSFAQLVGQESLSRLKPFIAEQVQVMGAQLARQQLTAMANTLTRLSVLEELAKEKLGETDDTLAERVADREDAALKMVPTGKPAEKGNQLRISFRGHEEGREATAEELEFTRATIRHLAVEPMQFPASVEEALLGASVGEIRTVVVDTGSSRHHKTGEEKKNPNMLFEVRVDRISAKVQPPALAPAPEAPAPEVPAEGGSDAAA